MEEPPLEPNGVESASHHEGSLKVEGLILASSSDTLLLDDVSFELSPGDRAFIQVFCATGTATARALLRALAGAKPLPRGGRILPGLPRSQVLLVGGSGFIFPPSSTLRQCLAYPDALGAHDEDLASALSKCGLGHLDLQLDRCADWPAILTPGDRQRMVFARLFVGVPAGVQWILLDEVDSAIDIAAAMELYGHLLAVTPRHVGIVAAPFHCEQVISQFASCRCFTVTAEGHALEESIVAMA